MTMTPRLRKFALTAHITFSVGWLGAVAVFLTHAIIGLTSGQSLLVRSAYLAMELSAWAVIVPACFGSLLTGIVQSLGTQWGLFKYYWIIVKLLLTIVITIFLLLHLEPIGYIARIAADTVLSATKYRGIRMQLAVAAAGALLVLLVITAISVFKPWGKIPYGFRKLSKKSEEHAPSRKKTTGFYVLIGLVILTLLVIIVHLFGGGLGGH
jgi:hypothetical protein